MRLHRGARLGPYEITAPIGAGGMGEVYKASDTRLDRVVAIKILPDTVADDPQRRERFRREARAISSLTHRHICTLYDVGEADDVEFLVMEYVAGETLEQRLRCGPLPIQDALQAAIEIADALDTAHRHGIVHRDLKPSNVMLTADGAKVLDFGLARDLNAEGGVVSPAGPSTLTQVGTIVGTVRYMAPEQLDGKPADARSDIFAFGAIVYEMVTGRRAFEGPSSAAIMAAILSATPPPMAPVQPAAPSQLDHVLGRCLAKDPEHRWQSARDLAAELRWIVGGDPLSAAARRHPTRRNREGLAWTVAATAGLVAVLAASIPTRSSNAPMNAMQFEIPPPEGSSGLNIPIVSPDGKRVAFVAAMANGQSLLWVRPLATLESKAIAQADDHAFPFWSADGRSLAFFGDGKLKKIDADGGPVQVICDAPAGRGGTWNRDGTIVFAPAANTPLFRVPSAGGVPVPVTRFSATVTERSHRFPHFLSDGRHFTYAAVSEPAAIAIGSLESSDSIRIVDDVETEAWTTPGYLVFVRDGNLLSQPFDAASMRFTGEAVPFPNRVAHGVVNQNEGFSISNNGVLTYVPRSVPPAQLTWLSRTGRVIAGFGSSGDYRNFAIAPDGVRVVAERGHPQSGQSEIWILDASRGNELRLVAADPEGNDPVWSPDGKFVAYDAWVPGRRQAHLFVKLANGTDSARLIPVARDFGTLVLDHWSPDGRDLLFELFDHSTAIRDLWSVPVGAGEQPRVFLRTAFNKLDARFSPDGRWVAYGSDESGRSEVYVQSFPDARSKYQVSTGGGSRPRWRRDGKELYYLTPTESLMMVPLAWDAGFTAGTPRPLFDSPNVGKGVQTRYDVAPNGERFLVNVVVPGARSPAIAVVLNWTADRKK